MVWSAVVCLVGLLVGQKMTSQDRHQLTTQSNKVNTISCSYSTIQKHAANSFSSFLAELFAFSISVSVFGTLKNNLSHFFHCNETERLVLGTHSSTNPKASMYPNKKNLDLVVQVNCSWKWIVEQKWIVIRMKFGLLLLRASLNSTLQFTFTQWLNWSCSNSLTCTWFRPKCFSEMSSKVIAICHYVHSVRTATANITSKRA